MMRIIADANILIASIFWSGIPCKIVEEALNSRIELITSTDALDEVRKVLKDPKEGFNLADQEIEDIINGILLYAKIIDSPIKVDVVQRDPKDNHIIASALAAKADYIVTRDKDLLELKEYNKIKIITPEEFLNLLK